jgi:WD repeat-containing protein 35
MALREYNDIIPTKTIYSLLGLVSFQGQEYSTCSKAFVKLESMDNSEEDNPYEELALSIFTRFPPVNTRSDYLSCGNCTAKVSPRYFKS